MESNTIYVLAGLGQAGYLDFSLSQPVGTECYEPTLERLSDSSGFVLQLSAYAGDSNIRNLQ